MISSVNNTGFVNLKNTQNSFKDNSNMQSLIKTENAQNDTFESGHKKKILTGAAIIGSLAVVGTTIWAYMRGKKVNEFWGDNTKLSSNLKEGFKSFFGKDKERYSDIKQWKVIDTSPIEGFDYESLKINKPPVDTAVEASIDASLVKPKNGAEVHEIPKIRPYTPEEAQGELDNAVIAIKGTGQFGDDFKARSLDDYKAGMTDIKTEIDGRIISGKLQDGATTRRITLGKDGTIAKIADWNGDSRIATCFDRTSGNIHSIDAKGSCLGDKWLSAEVKNGEVTGFSLSERLSGSDEYKWVWHNGSYDKTNPIKIA